MADEQAKRLLELIVEYGHAVDDQTWVAAYPDHQGRTPDKIADEFGRLLRSLGDAEHVVP